MEEIEKAADEYVAATGIPHSGGHLEAAFEAGVKWAINLQPDSWQWKFKHHDGSWSDWHDGNVRSWAIADGREYQERPLYALKINSGYT